MGTSSKRYRDSDDLRPVAGILFGLLLVVILYVGIWFFIFTDNWIASWIDPQPNLTEEPS